jgi:hypothetical protein
MRSVHRRIYYSEDPGSPKKKSLDLKKHYEVNRTALEARTKSRLDVACATERYIAKISQVKPASNGWAVKVGGVGGDPGFSCSDISHFIEPLVRWDRREANPFQLAEHKKYLFQELVFVFARACEPSARNPQLPPTLLGYVQNLAVLIGRLTEGSFLTAQYAIASLQHLKTKFGAQSGNFGMTFVGGPIIDGHSELIVRMADDAKRMQEAICKELEKLSTVNFYADHGIKVSTHLRAFGSRLATFVSLVGEEVTASKEATLTVQAYIKAHRTKAGFRKMLRDMYNPLKDAVQSFGMLQGILTESSLQLEGGPIHSVTHGHTGGMLEWYERVIPALMQGQAPDMFVNPVVPRIEPSCARQVRALMELRDSGIPLSPEQEATLDRLQPAPRCIEQGHRSLLPAQRPEDVAIVQHMGGDVAIVEEQGFISEATAVYIMDNLDTFMRQLSYPGDDFDEFKRLVEMVSNGAKGDHPLIRADWSLCHLDTGGTNLTREQATFFGQYIPADGMALFTRKTKERGVVTEPCPMDSPLGRVLTGRNRLYLVVYDFVAKGRVNHLSPDEIRLILSRAIIDYCAHIGKHGFETLKLDADAAKEGRRQSRKLENPERYLDDELLVKVISQLFFSGPKEIAAAFHAVPEEQLSAEEQIVRLLSDKKSVTTAVSRIEEEKRRKPVSEGVFSGWMRS